MNIYDLLKGRKIVVETDIGVEVTMEIESVKEQHHSRQITPDTQENDWWGESVNWSTYNVKFTNGHTKSYKKLIDLKILN